MNKITKKLLKSLLVTSALSLLHSNAVAQNIKQGPLDDLSDDDNQQDEISSLKRKVIKNVVKVSPTGRMSMVNDHYSHSSHSSHSSHYSGSYGGGGHYSHSSHSSHSSHYSGYGGGGGYSRSSGGGYESSSSSYTPSGGSSRSYSTPKPKPKIKTAADYTLGDRTIKSGTYGADVNTLAELLISNLYVRRSALSSKGGYYVCGPAMISAIKHFQRDAGYTATGSIDANMATALQAWNPSKTSVDLGIRDIKVNTAGQDVNQLIVLLTKAGYAPDPKKLKYSGGNAVFTKDVQMAVKVFQAYNHLRVTGNPDSATLAKLKSGK